MNKFKFLFLIILLVNCSLKKDNINISLIKADWTKLKKWNQDDHLAALDSFSNSCVNFSFYYKDKILNKHYNSGKADDWQKICDKLKKLENTKNSAKKFFEENFDLYLVKENDKDKGLFTGYYEIDLNASRIESEKYKYPIYSKPANIANIRHYSEHKHINNGFLAGRNLEIFYVDNLIDLFFLHIQGSGILNLNDGKKIRIGYEAQNGHKYYAIGRYFIGELKIDKNLINADYIREYLENNPVEAKSIIELNPSYVFFKINDKSSPIGSFNVPLIPGRSLAVDKNYIPLGIPVWLEVILPDGNNFDRLLIAQDTGGAIKGVIRGDIFFGNGKGARKYASNMKSFGSYYILLPKNIAK